MARKRSHGSHDEHMDESWLIPYADLLTLLLALFIVLFAASNVDKEKYNAMAQAFFAEFRNSGGVMEGDSLPYKIPSVLELPPSITDLPADGDSEEDLSQIMADEEKRRLDLVKEELQRYFDQEGLSANVSLHIDERGLVISFNDSVLFDLGSSDIKPEYTPLLVKMAAIINRLDNYIRVEGHTDNVPISSARFASNWELSCGRASRVVRLFISDASIPPEKVVAVGYAEYKPIEDNSTPEGRAKNRRVDVIILNRKFNSLEDERNG